MGEMRKTYSLEFKQRAVEMFINEALGYKTVANGLGIDDKMVRRWVAHYEREGLKGLHEKRGTLPARTKSVNARSLSVWKRNW